MKFAYYPGCSPKTTTPELDQATRKLTEKLEIGLVDLNEASCCGSVEIRSRNPALNYALNARTLALAEAKGLNILTICSTCQLVLGQANRGLKAKPELRERTNKVLSEINIKYDGRVEVKHLLWILVQDIGLEKLSAKIVKPLTGLKVAPFYGCHILRPKEVLNFEDPDRPESLEKLIEVCGGEAVDYPGKTKCCGFHILMVNEKLALRMIARYLHQAKERGAECIVTPCPLCHTALDAYQKDAAKESGFKLGLPILHLPQLVGLALGISGSELMMSRHMVSPRHVLEKIGVDD